ncbi:hypothetical protein HHX47_DHR1000917 [Lentinula edodes]|nr:hypothetical protein HHX47_DHR1000917 [Lentinula edodes]
MGKSQKKKSMRRHNPMRVPDSHLPKGLASASSTSTKNEAILPIIQKMEGPDASDRKWACVAVSNLIQNDSSTRRLLQGKNVVGALITRLTDSEDEVVLEAMGALSETSNKALNAINSINLIPFLMSFLASRDKLSIAPVLAAAQSLNQPANGKGKDINDHRLITLRVLSSGILRNISPLPQPSAASIVDIDKDITLPLLQPVISSVQLPEIASRAQQLVDGLALEPQIERMSLKNTPKSDHKSSSELELEQLEANLRTVQLALEILTGVCATLPDPSAGIEGETEIDDEDEDMADDDEVLDETNIEDPGHNNDSANPTVLPSLVPSLLSLIQPTSLSFPPLATSSIHPPTTTALSAIHISAMECLNNIFLSLATSPNPSVSADAEGGRKVWNEVWASLGVVGTELGLGQERRKEMWEIGVGVLWGLALVWKGTLVIASYLLTLLPTPSSPSPAGVESLMQAVSALIDIYSDETLPYDINFRQGGMLQTLVASVENVRKAVKRIDRKKPGGKDLRRRGEEIRDNLVAFIQYRRNLGLQN